MRQTHLLYLSFITFTLMSCGDSVRASDAAQSNDTVVGEGCTLPDGRRIAIGASTMVSCNTCMCTAMGLGCTLQGCADSGASVFDDVVSRCDPVLFPFSGVCGASVEYPCGAPGGPVDLMVSRERCAQLCLPAAMRFPALRITGDCSGLAGTNNTVRCLCGPMR